MKSDFLITLDERSGVSSPTLRLAAWCVRIALALVFVSIVVERLGRQGPTDLELTLVWLLPTTLLRVVSLIATCAEILLVLALLTGWQQRWSALLGALILLIHGVVMWVSAGPLVPLAYFDFLGAGAAFLLFVIQPAIGGRKRKSENF